MCVCSVTAVDPVDEVSIVADLDELLIVVEDVLDAGEDLAVPFSVCKS
jgi:hypothetical protein